MRSPNAIALQKPLTFRPNVLYLFYLSFTLPALPGGLFLDMVKTPDEVRFVFGMTSGEDLIAGPPDGSLAGSLWLRLDSAFRGRPGP